MSSIFNSTQTRSNYSLVMMILTSDSMVSGMALDMLVDVFFLGLFSPFPGECLSIICCRATSSDTGQNSSYFLMHPGSIDSLKHIFRSPDASSVCITLSQNPLMCVMLSLVLSCSYWKICCMPPLWHRRSSSVWLWISGLC